MFGTSKALLAAMAGLLAGALVAPGPASAQEPTSVTGCLSKGTAGGTFSISGIDGKAYSLTSTTVKLESHVGHKVTVTGAPAAVETGAVTDTGMAKDTGMAHDTGMTKDTGMKKETAATGGGALNVTRLTMVSADCS